MDIKYSIANIVSKLYSKMFKYVCKHNSYKYYQNITGITMKKKKTMSDFRN